MPKRGGGNPLTKAPCPECQQKIRHAPDCPRKRQSGGRKLNVDRFAEKLKRLTDDEFAEVVRAIVAQAAERKRAIEFAAASKLRVLDEILPRLGNVTPMPPAPRIAVPTASLPRLSEAKRPANACPAICPDNVEIGCFQPKGHEGDHHNPIAKHSWPKR